MTTPRALLVAVLATILIIVTVAWLHASPSPPPSPTGFPHTGGVLRGPLLIDAHTATLPTWTTGSNDCAGDTGGVCADPPWPTAPGQHNNVPMWGLYDSGQTEIIGGPKRLLWVNYNATSGQASINGVANNYESQTIYYGGNGSDVHHLPTTTGCCEGGDHYFGGGAGNNDGHGGGTQGGAARVHGGAGGNGLACGSADIDAGNPAAADGSWAPAAISACGGLVTGSTNVGICGSTSILIGSRTQSTSTVVRGGSAAFNLGSTCQFTVGNGTDTRFSLDTEATINGLNRTSIGSTDATTTLACGKNVGSSNSPACGLVAGGATIFTVGTQGTKHTLTDYENLPAMQVTSSSTVANGKDFFVVDNNGTNIIKARTNAAGGDTVDVYGAQSSDVGPFVVVGVGGSNVGTAATLDSATNVGGHKWSWEALGSFWTSTSAYWTNGMRLVDATLGKVRMTMGGSTFAGGANDGGELRIGANPPVNGGALLQVEGNIAITTSGAGGVKTVCIQSDGITLGYGTAAEILAGTCHALSSTH